MIHSTIGQHVFGWCGFLVLVQAAAAALTPSSEPSDATVFNAPCSEQIARVEEASQPPQEVAACIEAARCILVERCAEPLSLLLYERLDQHGALRSAAEEAQQLLERATRALGEIDLDDESLTVLIDCTEQLLAFAEMYSALAKHQASNDEAARKQLIEACVGLSLFLDDPRPGVVEAARLWQGAAYRRAGRPDRALQVLRPVLSAPKSPRIGLLARIERCRALADRGEYAASLALTLRLTRRVEGWFREEDEKARQQAAETVKHLRVDLLRKWAEKLRAEGHETLAAHAEKEAESLQGEESRLASADRHLRIDVSITELPHCEDRLRASALPGDSTTEDDEADDELDEMPQDDEEPQEAEEQDRDKESDRPE